MFGRSFSLTGLASIALLCLPACAADTGGQGNAIGKDEAAETFAKQLCTAFYECDCTDAVDPSPFTSEAQCEAQIEAAIQADLDRADDADLFYDGSCAATILDYLEGLDCTAWGDLSLEDLSSLSGGYGCKVFYGNDEPGDSCEAINNNSDDTCVQEATCTAGTCAAREELAQPGDACSPVFSLCAEGAVCLDKSGGSNNVCERLPEVGSTCLGTLDLCSIDLSCNQDTKQCELAPGDGETCAPPALSACGNGLYCDADTCTDKPTGGDACTPNPGCGTGFACNNMGTCVTDPAVICSYTVAAL